MRLLTLGRLALEGSDFTRRKPLLLLAYLALEGPQERGYLSRLFWPYGKDPRASLRVALALIRAAAPDAVGVADGVVRTTVRCDAADLLGTVDEAEVGGLEDGGPGLFAAGFDAADLSSELEEWLYDTRERVAGRVRALHLRRAEAHLRYGRPHRALPLARSALELQTTRAPSASELRRLARVFDRTHAPELRTVRELAASVGVAIEPRDLLDGVPNNLPPRTTSFVGRTEELARIERLLASDDARLVTLHGPGGTGKSRLALEACRRAVELVTAEDGVFFVPLEEIPHAAAAPLAIAEAMGLPLADDQSAGEGVIDAIGSACILLVLDNVEHLAEAWELPSRMVRACPSLHILTTSRRRLRVPSEHVVHVSGLGVDGTVGTSDAEALFLDRARQASGEVVADPGRVSELCGLLHGMPLALELAAAWTDVLSVDDLVREVGTDVAFLASRDAGASVRSRSLEAAYDVSWRLLDERERQALLRLSVFRGGFDREAAEQVAGVRVDQLGVLSDKALIRFDGTSRYERHPLLGEFGERRRRARAELDLEAQDAHARYYLAWTRRTGQDVMAGDRMDVAYRAIEREFANVRAAWFHAVPGDLYPTEGLARIACYLTHLSEQRNRYSDAHELFESVRSALDPADPDERLFLGEMDGHHSFMIARLGRPDEARARARGALEHLASLPPLATFRGRWAANQSILLASLTVGDFDTARDHVRTSIGIADAAREALSETTVDRAEADTLHGLALAASGLVEMFAGDFAAAQTRLRSGLDVLEHTRAAGRTYAYWGLAQTAMAVGDPARSADLVEAGLRVAEESGFRSQEGEMLGELARACLADGRLDDADRAARRGLELSRWGGNTWSQVQILALLGRIEMAYGRAVEARTAWRTSATLALQHRHESFVSEALLGVAEDLARRGELAEAASLARTIAEADGVPGWAAAQALELAEALGSTDLKTRSFDEWIHWLAGEGRAPAPS